MTKRQDTQAQVDALTAKQGVPDSVTPTNLAGDQLQTMLDNSTMIDESPNTEWVRTTSNYTATRAFEWIDVFPATDDVVITMPDPSLFGNKVRIDVYNQTDQGFNLLINDHLGGLLQEALPAKAFSLFWDIAQAKWEIVQTSGLAVPQLDPTVYGNFNANAWADLPTAIYKMSATGAQLSGFPANYVFNPVSTYNFEIDFINEVGVVFGQRTSFSTDSDFANPNVGRQINRIGIDLGSMITTGWRVYIYEGESMSTISLKDDSGNLRGEISGTDDFGMTVVGKNDTGSSDVLTLVGSTTLVAGDQVAMQFNGASDGNFLRILNKTEINGQDVFLLSTTPLDVIEYSETFIDSTDKILNTSYQDIVAGNVVNEYRADTSIANTACKIENTSNTARVIDYYLSVNDAAPTPDDLQSATVPAKSGNTNGNLDLSFSDTSQTLIGVGAKVSLKIKLAATATGVTVKGTVSDSKLLIEQTASIVNVGQAVSDVSADTVLQGSNYFRLTSGSNYTLPAASTVFSASTPYGMYIKNVSGSDIEVAAFAGDDIYTDRGVKPSITIQDGENYSLIAGDSSTWDVTSSYRKQNDVSVPSGTMRRINVFDNTLNPVAVVGTGTQNIIPPADDTGALNGFVKVDGFVQGSAPAALNGWSIVNSNLVAGAGTTGTYQVGGAAQFFHANNNSAVAFVVGHKKAADGITYFTPSASISTMPNSDQIGLNAGEGAFHVVEGDELSLWVASENSDPELGIPNASLTAYRINTAETPAG